MTADTISEDGTEFTARTISLMKDYYKANGTGYGTDYSLNNIYTLAQEDSTFMSGLTTITDKVMEGGWTLSNRKSGNRESKKEIEFHDKKFNQFLRDLTTTLVAYGTTFAEIEKDNPDSLFFVPETSQMRIHADEHGNINFYQQQVNAGGKNSQDPTWKTDEMGHTKDISLVADPFGEVQLKTIHQSISIKHHVKKFLQWLFETNQFRSFFNIESTISDDMLKEVITLLRKSDTDIKRPIVMMGNAKYSPIRDGSDLDKYLSVLYKMDEDILMALQVPPIFAGLPDNSNRSNSDAQIKAFNTRVNSIKRIIEDFINFDIFKKAKLSRITFRFGITDKMTEEAVLTNVAMMRKIGFKDDIIIQYLKDKGFPLMGKDVFEPKPEFNPEIQSVDDKMGNNPSRERKKEDEVSKDIGVGEESTTREDQINES